MSILKNEIPILEFDSAQRAVIDPEHEKLDLKLPEKCVFAFLGDYIDEYAKKHGAEFAVYNPKETVGVLENLGFIQYERGQLKRSNQDTLAFEVIFGEESLAYVGSSYFESMGYGINENIKDADCVIYGTHGPNPKKLFLADSVKTADETVIADDELLSLAEIDFTGQKNVKITVNCEKYETVLRRKNKP